MAQRMGDDETLGSACEACRLRVGARSGRFRLAGSRGHISLCLRHALIFPPLMRRSIAIALIVGTLLTALNQGDRIASAQLDWQLAWKVPLTYCVPYWVATVGALSNALRR